MAATLGDLGHRQLAALCEVYGFPSEAARPILDRLGASWTSRRVDALPPWSGITSDCSPYELSVVFGSAASELRILSEPQAVPASPAAYWAASRALHRALGAEPGVRLERLASVEDLFAPSDPQAHLAACHAAVLRPGAPPSYKVYLSPFGRGRPAAMGVLDAALARLGHARAWASLRAAVRPGDDVGLLSLDLAAGPSARVKLYLRPRPSTRTVLVEGFGRGRDGAEEDAGRFWDALAGGPGGAWPRPIYVCHHLVDPADDRPARVALQAPLWPGLGDDLEVRARVGALFGAFGVDPAPFLAVYRRMQDVTDPGGGLLSWVSFQRERGRPRITAYFNPKAYAERWGWNGIDPEPPWWPSPVRPGAGADRS